MGRVAYLTGLLVALAVFLHAGRIEPAPIRITGSDRNLLPNGSFESGGRPTLEGWRVNNGALTSLVAEPAPGGGNWSLELEADWAPTSGYITAPIPDLRNGDVLQLSAYLRALSTDGGGAIGIAVGKSYELAQHFKHVESTDTSWTQVSLQDTVSIAEGDTVWVVLSSFHTESVRREGLFDRVVLLRLSGTTDAGGPSRQVLWLSPPAPNPARGEALFRFVLPRGGRVSIGLFDAGGRLVRELARGEFTSGEHPVRWDGRNADGRNAASGIYHVRLEVEGRSVTRRLVVAR